MQICEAHWVAMRQAIEDRGLSSLVAKDGRTAIGQLEQQLQQGADSRETFDPLMSVHWVCVNNAMRFLDGAGMNPLYLLGGGPEDPVEGYAGYEGRTWPRCPICYLNLAHEVSCRHEKCELDKERGYDWMIERAASDALDKAREYGLAPKAS